MNWPTGKDLGGYRKRGWWTLAPGLWHSLSPHSVCKKSPNLLAALLPLLDLSLKQCQREVQSCAGKNGFPGAIRPKKEYIKSCETCFANTLNLNDKGQSMKWVCFLKSYSPLANWPWLRISPQSSLLSIVWSLLPDNDWWALPVFLCELNPIKAHWGKCSWSFSFERSATSPPQADGVLVDLFSSVAAGEEGRPCRLPPHSSFNDDTYSLKDSSLHDFPALVDSCLFEDMDLFLFIILCVYVHVCACVFSLSNKVLR